MEWTDGADRLLRQLRGEGFSFAEMVKRFAQAGYNVTKGSIIGRADRRGIKGPKKSRIVSPRKIQKLTAIVSGTVSQSRSASGTRPPTRDLAGGPFLGIALIDLQRCHCRYPQGENPTLFCGQPKLDPSPYCAKHTKLCFVGGSR